MASATRTAAAAIIHGLRSCFDGLTGTELEEGSALRLRDLEARVGDRVEALAGIFREAASEQAADRRRRLVGQRGPVGIALDDRTRECLSSSRRRKDARP